MFDSAKKALQLFHNIAGKKMYFIFFLMVVASILEMASLGLVIPLIQATTLNTSETLALTTPNSIFYELSTKFSAHEAALAFCFIFIAKNLLILGIIYYTNSRIFFYSSVAKKELFRSYLNKEYSFHTNNNSSRMLHNIIISLGHSFETVRQVFMVFLEGILCVAAITLLLFVEPVVTLVVALTLAGTTLIFYRAFSPRFQYWGQHLLDLEANQMSWIRQGLDAITLIKIAAKEEVFVNILGNLTQKRAVIESRTSTSLQIPRLYLETVTVISIIAMIGALIAVGRSQTELITVIGLFGMAALRLLPSLTRLVAAMSEIRRRAAFIDEIYDDLFAETAKKTQPEDEEELNFQKSIEIVDVSFAYSNGEGSALQGVNLSIKKGQTVGIVGPSGAGKTTLINLILGFLQPQLGQLKIDGIPLGKNVRSWQRLVGYVPQDTYVFDDTLEQNITLAFDNEKIDETKLRDAIRDAKLEEFVHQLPRGLTTKVGEQGSLLSGGQRQRIAVGRALYGDPAVLVFDEATSSVDNESENELSKAVKNLSGQKTVLIIAHRLSTIRDCDLIVYMDHGRIEDIGTFEALYERCKPFRHLVELGDLHLGESEGACA